MLELRCLQPQRLLQGQTATFPPQVLSHLADLILCHVLTLLQQVPQAPHQVQNPVVSLLFLESFQGIQQRGRGEDQSGQTQPGNGEIAVPVGILVLQSLEVCAGRLSHSFDICLQFWAHASCHCIVTTSCLRTGRGQQLLCDVMFAANGTPTSPLSVIHQPVDVVPDWELVADCSSVKQWPIATEVSGPHGIRVSPWRFSWELESQSPLANAGRYMNHAKEPHKARTQQHFHLDMATPV
mmetsp:Transcript_42447/g.92479  ORF Transcript_42447/g.92479 Transcript_42447/m.92479 type:complete len:239 (-) Transcript_42447:1028-1744(-)